jgi:hypothetical protein
MHRQEREMLAGSRCCCDDDCVTHASLRRTTQNYGTPIGSWCHFQMSIKGVQVLLLTTSDDVDAELPLQCSDSYSGRPHSHDSFLKLTMMLSLRQLPAFLIEIALTLGGAIPFFNAHTRSRSLDSLRTRSQLKLLRQSTGHGAQP